MLRMGAVMGESKDLEGELFRKFVSSTPTYTTYYTLFPLNRMAVPARCGSFVCLI